MYNFCKNAKKFQTQNTLSKSQRDTDVHREAQRGRKRYKFFIWLTVASLDRGISVTIGRMKREDNEIPNTLEGN
jgi:hypothetical protein